MSELHEDVLVALVVLNWRQVHLTLECLRSIRLMCAEGMRLLVIVVDNASGDGSIEIISDRFPEVQIISTEKNLGYAGGNNAGIRLALDSGAEAVCILNNDVTVDPGFLGPLLAKLKAQSDVGIVTPLVAETSDSGGRVWALGSRVNCRTGAVTRSHAGEPVERWREQLPFEVDIASGAAMLAKRAVFETVGLLDEKYFLYFEETDWCLSCRKAGYRILAVPASVVWHRVSGTLGAMSPIIDYYMLRNHLRLIVRHWSGLRRPYLLIRTVARNLATIAAYTVKPKGGQRVSNRDARLLAMRDVILGRWGQMGADVAKVCYRSR